MTKDIAHASLQILVKDVQTAIHSWISDKSIWESSSEIFKASLFLFLGTLVEKEVSLIADLELKLVSWLIPTLVMDAASDTLLYFLAKFAVAALNSRDEDQLPWPTLKKEKNECYHQGLRLMITHSCMTFYDFSHLIHNIYVLFSSSYNCSTTKKTTSKYIISVVLNYTGKSPYGIRGF